jgi:PBP1b-binding outer membrane lipoprotein LpoB
MRLLKVVIISLVLTGCSEKAMNEAFPSEYQRAQNLSYVKDERTNLCFVHNYVQNSSLGTYHIFTNVPCSPEVEKLIKK